jgi:hypothetical protein
MLLPAFFPFVFLSVLRGSNSSSSLFPLQTGATKPVPGTLAREVGTSSDLTKNKELGYEKE